MRYVNRWLAASRIAVGFLLLVSSHVGVAQAKWPQPDWNKPDSKETMVCNDEVKTPVYSLGNYELRIIQVPASDICDHMCRAYLVNQKGDRKLLLEDFRILIHQGTGEDIFGSGHASVVLEGWSGGAHCCWTYSIVDLGSTPLVLPNIENDTGFFFFKDSRDGRYRILAADGAFDYFDDMCHACSALPHVVLEVGGGRLQHVSSRYVAEYDTEIGEAKAEVDQDELGRFLTVPNVHQSEQTFEELRQHVLNIVLAYLYSGREAQPWQALNEMWPTSDKARIKKLILDTKREGLLSKLSDTSPKHEEISSPK